MRIQKVDNSLTFTRKPNQKEMQIYTSSVNEGLKLLGKQVDVILHNASAPAVKSENTGIGSLFSRTNRSFLITVESKFGARKASAGCKYTFTPSGAPGM